jgi:hypothetical protein
MTPLRGSLRVQLHNGTVSVLKPTKADGFEIRTFH